jgi:hypothetical protein
MRNLQNYHYLKRSVIAMADYPSPEATKPMPGRYPKKSEIFLPPPEVTRPIPKSWRRSLFAAAASLVPSQEHHIDPKTLEAKLWNI